MEHAHEENGAKKVAKAFITAGLALIALVLIAAAIVIGSTGDSSPGVKLSNNRPAATQRAEQKAPAGDMTPPPADVSVQRECPLAEMTPPAPRLEVDTTRQPPRASSVNYVTLPQKRGVARIPGPKKVGEVEEWTTWVRVPTRAGFTLRPHSLPEEADWVQEARPDEDSEGYKWVRWRHKEGAIRAETVVLVVD